MQGGIEEHEQILDELGVEHRRVRRPEHLEGINAMILPGGESTTMSKLLELNEVYEPLRKALDQGLPVFGTCAGMILLATDILDTRPDAKKFSAIDMTVRRNAFGRQVDSFEVDLDVDGIDGPMEAIFIRAPWVEKAGQDVRILATVPTGPAQGMIVAVKQGNALATAFHPECTGEKRIHEMFVRDAQAVGLSAHANGTVTPV
ncbi:glutamine amidotransferase [Corynebacterium aquilae DSM 44791]|uniref:Pyridoxal 5'-phosphate synthase subunit PdxT n=2 Tax=Corynebacterium aquilae TaxID=203263 RepID=A0A1L7CGC5_9CORY|nr:glutamine amidotransferase [Corynebacterium aquilae DSM 44791]